MDGTNIADLIIQQIEQGAGQWEMPWHKGFREAINPLTHRPYQAQNAWILWLEGNRRGCSSVEWATLRQWAKLGGRLRRGCKGVRVYYPLRHHQTDLMGGSSGVLAGFRHYTVFNYDDVNGIDRTYPDLFGDPAPDYSPLRENGLAERIANASGADIRYEGDQACYMLASDRIYMPPRQNFKASLHATAGENFYATLLHELVHWTSPQQRCDRHSFSEDLEQACAFEELVAELGAAVLNTRFHKLPEPRQDHAAYISGWLYALRDDISYLYKALGLAQKAADWLCAKAGITLQDLEWRPAPEAETPILVAAATSTAGPVQATSYTLLDRPTNGMPRYHRVEIVCGHCAEPFRVTLDRTSIGSYCTFCDRFNQLNSAAQVSGA